MQSTLDMCRFIPTDQYSNPEMDSSCYSRDGLKRVKEKNNWERDLCRRRDPQTNLGVAPPDAPDEYEPASAR